MRFKNDLKNAATGVISALLSSYFVAVLFAYLFRVPIPLVGYIGPFGQLGSYTMPAIEVLRSVLAAWFFYGIFGGFLILVVGGFITGVLVGRKASNTRRAPVTIALWSSVVGAVPVFALSVLDFVVGPW